MAATGAHLQVWDATGLRQIVESRLELRVNPLIAVRGEIPERRHSGIEEFSGLLVARAGDLGELIRDGTKITDVCFPQYGLSLVARVAQRCAACAAAGEHVGDRKQQTGQRNPHRARVASPLAKPSRTEGEHRRCPRVACRLFRRSAITAETRTNPGAPSDLAARGRAFWRATVADFDLSDVEL